MEILVTALAAFWGWTALRFILPFAIPDRLALLLYGASTWGLTIFRLPHGLLDGMASAGGLVFITVFTRIDTPAYWDWRAPLELLRPRLPARPRPRMHPQDKPRPGRRIPRI